MYTDEFRARHSSSFRLTERGCKQAEKAGAWIRKEFPGFDRYLVSEYLRALETAALLNLPGADWLHFVRPRYTNEDLLEIVSRTQATVS